jgi:hypothetical protein
MGWEFYIKSISNFDTKIKFGHTIIIFRFVQTEPAI